MKLKRRLVAACAAAALTTLSATAASADLVDNSIDAGVDSTLETMTLQYPGAAGATTLAIIVDGVLVPADSADHPGCNINGGPHYLDIDAVVTEVGNVVDVTLSNDGKFDDCTDTVIATVTPHSVGTATVSFTGTWNTSNSPSVSFNLTGASFQVTVNPYDGTGTPPKGCDEDPAAPAWARKLLKGNGLKPRMNGVNYVSEVAHQMGLRASFPSGSLWIDKSTHPAYEDAVWTYLKGRGLSLPNGPTAVTAPGQQCRTAAAPTS